MKKIFLTLIFSLFFGFVVSGYGGSAEFKHSAILHLDQIRLIDTTVLQFDVFIERLDLGMKQIKTSTDMLTVDLPKSLQPKLMFVSTATDHDPETGSWCDVPRFPHRCELTLEGTEKEKTVLVKMTFEDDTYIEEQITIAIPKALKKPSIIIPKKTPAKGKKFRIRFKNITAASHFEVKTELCKKYGNDGINPCLDEIVYYLKRENGKLIIQNNSPTYPAKLRETKNFIELKSDFPLNYEESVTFGVKGISEQTNSQGTKIYREQNDWKNFQ